MRTDNTWDTGPSGTYVRIIKPGGMDVLINGTDRYWNFAVISGFAGYGFRDNAGTIEFKNSGGAWTPAATALGFTAENIANKSTNVTTDGTSDTKYPSVKAVKDYADGLVAGLLDYRGAYDASVNTFPASGGSGTAGAIMKGDMWVVSVAGTLGGVAIQIGDYIIANTDTPAQTASKWDSLNTNIGYVPEDAANKVTSISAGSTDTQYGSAKLLYDQLAGKISTYGSTTAKYFLAAPNAGDGTPSFRAIVASDIPALSYAAPLGAQDNYVTDNQLIVIGNTSNTNTGDNATNSQYSGLASSKLDANFLSLGSLTDPNINALMAWDDTDGALKFLTIGTGLSYDHATHTLSSPDAGGDMILASVQSVTGLKTFDTSKIAIKGSSTGINTIANANASATDYINTLPAKTGTFAMTSDITGTNSGTNTGDNAVNSNYSGLVTFPGFGTSHSTAAYGDHNHSGVYDVAGAAAAVTPTTLGLVIGTNVLAYRTFGSAANSATTDFLAANGKAVDSDLLDNHDTSYFQVALTFGIADTNKVQINAADVADNDYAKFTATGLEGRSYAEVLSDIGAQASLGFTPEDVANKSTSMTTDATSTTKYPSVKLIKDYADNLIVGLLDYRGAYDVTGTNAYPATGGSGTAGAILKGDMWIISVAGTMGTAVVQVGDSLIANVDTPAQTDASWNVLNGNVSYVPENVANKVTSISAGSTDTQYPSAKLLFDQLAGKQASGSYLTSVGTGVTNELTYWSGTNTLGSLATATYPSLTELAFMKGVTSGIQGQLNGKQASGSYLLASDITGKMDKIADPNADRLYGWDNTDNDYKYFAIGTNLSYNHSTHTISAIGGTGGSDIIITPADDIQTYLNTIYASGGGILFLAAGTYILTADISIPSGVTLQGIARDSVIIDCNTSYSVRIEGTDIYSTGNVTIANGDTTVVGSGTTFSAGMVGRNILLNGNWYEIVTFTNTTHIEIYAYNGVNLTNSSYVLATLNVQGVLKELTVTNSTGSGVIIAYASEPILSNLYIYGCGTGIDMDYVVYPQILVTSNENGVNMDLNYTYGSTIDFSDFSFSTVGAGIVMTNSGNMNFYSSTANDNATNGVSCTNVEECPFLGSAFDGNGACGIEFISGCNYNQITNCAISNNVSDGVKFTATSDNNVIVASNITDNGGYGINIANANCDNNIINEINYSGNVSGTLSNSGTGTSIVSGTNTGDGTYGIANTNYVKIDSASVANGEYAKFTANGLESRSTAEVLSDIGAAAALSGTINEIAYFSSATTIASLAVATYPSLAELAFVKGLSSAIQTQLNGKQASGAYLTTVDISANTNLAVTAPIVLTGDTLSIPAATASVNGYATSTQITKLDGIAAGATANTKATGAEVDTGTDDAKFVTAKAMEDSAYIKSGVALPLAGGTMTGTIIQNSYINLSSPASDHTATGNATNAFQSGYTAAAFDLVFMGSASKWLEVDSNAVATCKGLLGIALEAKNNTEAMLVALPGSFVRDDTWAWTIGATLYAGETLGTIQETIPTGADAIIKVIGFAVTADVIFFNPSPDQQSVVA